MTPQKEKDLNNNLKDKTIIKARHFLKVQDGCEQFCSYCIIPYARGSLKSKGKKEVLNELEECIKKGAKEIVLSGIHLGLYGKDLKEKLNLTELVKSILKLKGLGRLRLSSIEVNEVSDELLELLKNEKKICKHLHIPLQSGSGRILQLMNRPYSKEEIYSRLLVIKKNVPDIAITTDVIVGFPGETEAEFLETCEFVKKIKFSKVHVFPYSLHEKTAAAKFPNQVSSNEKKRRSEVLRAIGEKLEKEYIASFKNKEHELMVEQIKGDKVVMKSEYYFDIEEKLQRIEKILGLSGNDIIGRTIKWNSV